MSCNEKINTETNVVKNYKESDLSFFNVKGKIKKYAEIKAVNDLDEKTDFKRYHDYGVNYYDYNFDSNGKITKIENVNPSPYAEFRFKITPKRTENSLEINQRTSKEIFNKKYCKTGDTLSIETYNKIDDLSFDYHLEKYKQQLFLKENNGYKTIGLREGLTSKNITSKSDYFTVTDRSGNDSLVYLIEADKSKTLIYSFKYLKFDGKGNWLKRQVIKKDNTRFADINSYSEFRKIEYHD